MEIEESTNNLNLPFSQAKPSDISSQIVEESTNNINLPLSQAKASDISSQIVEEKPSIMIEISSDEENHEETVK